MTQPEPIADENPPAFNIPHPVLLLVVAMVAVHLIRTQLIGPQADFWVLNTFAFWPIFYHAQHKKFLPQHKKIRLQVTIDASLVLSGDSFDRGLARFSKSESNTTFSQ